MGPQGNVRSTGSDCSQPTFTDLQYKVIFLIVVQYQLRLVETGSLLKNLGSVAPYVQNCPHGFGHEST